MKTRYRLTCRGIRGGKYYCVDNSTGKRTSLRTTSRYATRAALGFRSVFGGEFNAALVAPFNSPE